MKKQIVISMIIILSLLFTACEQAVEEKDITTSGNSESANSQIDQTQQNKLESTESQTDDSKEISSSEDSPNGKREVEGVNGEIISLPPAEDIQRVVIMAPIAFPSVLNVIPDYTSLTGINPVVFNTSEQKILGQVFPEWEEINTTFLEKDSYGANIEELLKLDPDIIFYDAKWQGEGMDKLDIPLVDINMYKSNFDVENITITYEKVFKNIFGVKSESILQSKWDDVNAKLKEIINEDQDPKTALFIWSNMGDQISIYGNGTYVESYCNKLHLTNVANELEGYPEVSMEQIYQWNPDYIFILKGFSGDNNAERMLTQTDDNNWSKLIAFKNQTIYDVPKTLLGWVSPSTDSPLMVYWLISKCYPNKLSNDELSDLFHEHYQSVHGVNLNDDVIRHVLGE